MRTQGKFIGMYCELLPLLTEDFLLLTANQRLSHYLQQKLSLSAEQISPLDVGLMKFWQQQTSDPRMLLSDFQERWLWEEIIRTSAQGENIAQLRETTFLVQQAWERLHQWRLSPSDFVSPNETVKAFSEWASVFQHQLNERQMLTTTQLPAQLISVLSQICWPKRIILIGFDELTPAIQHLFSSLEKFTEVIYYAARATETQVYRKAFPDEETEIRSLALFAKQLLTQQKNSRIGCLIPNLSIQRAKVFSIFDEIFPEENVFNISAGQSLMDYPIIQCAFQILSLSPSYLSFQILSPLLRSPYLNYLPEEAAYAATLEIRLRQLEKMIFTSQDLLSTTLSPTTFKTRFENWITIYQIEKTMLLSEWAQQFSQELTALGWPGQRKMDSHESQLLARWNRLLTEEFPTVTLNTQLYSRSKAFAYLQNLLQHTIFQPKTVKNAPIQILGLLEAAGVEFDYLWITGLNQEQWPTPAKPNPFLPIALQRQHQMPHASAQRQFYYTQQLQKRLLRSASTIYLSYAEQKSDQHLKPSRLILEFPVLEHLSLAPHEDLALSVFKTKSLEKFTDETAPSVTEQESIRGGSSILKYQSLCPFRAFATIRLKATYDFEPSLGLDGKDRGNLMHAALEQIWKKIQSQENLLQYTEADLKAFIEKNIDQLLNQQIEKETLFKRSEKKRLTHLIHQWLLSEKSRPPFSVCQRETLQQIQVGPLKMALKIDRIDQLENGDYFIIDYKSNTLAGIKDWFGERPQDIQLPLYSTFGFMPAAGMAYAQVRLGHMEWIGILSSHPKEDYFSKIQNDQKLPDPIPNWLSAKQFWQNTLTQLAVDFYEGKAAVNPIDENTCRYCHLKPLCRIGSADEH